MAASADLLTVGQVAEHFGVPYWKAERIFRRGQAPTAGKVGAYRVVRRADLGKVEQALRACGYLPKK